MSICWDEVFRASIIRGAIAVVEMLFLRCGCGDDSIVLEIFVMYNPRARPENVFHFSHQEKFRHLLLNITN